MNMQTRTDRAALLFARLSLLAILTALILASVHTSASAQVNMFGGMRAPAPTGIAGWILAKQALFYRALDGMIRAAKTNGSAYWGLIGISFIYGIFHAAGPGHGKAVISSYLVANEETWRRGIALSFAAALLQACTAIAIVSVAALILGATAKMMGDTVKVIETVSYSLIVLLGARLFWVKGKSFLHAWRAFRVAGGAAAAGTKKHSHHAHAAHVHHAHETHAHHVLTAVSYVHAAHDHCEHHAHETHSHEEHAHETHEQLEHEYALAAHAHHDSGNAHVTLHAAALTPTREGAANAHPHRHSHQHGHDTHRHGHGQTHVHDDDEEESVLPWGHAHGPEPEELAGPGGWRRGLSAIVAVGLRPCSGAIIVLVFALSQGLYWAGVASTVVMGLGTAITVSSIASVAVGARSLAKRLATSRPGYASLILRGGEAAAGFLVIVFGIALLTGYMASERMGMF
jgi:nickel/cobalt transporter (NicO) family protein